MNPAGGSRKEPKRERLFVVTSFQGGVGKSSVAWRFAHAYRNLTNKDGAVIEWNRFTPSYLVQALGLRDKIPHSFMDFFMTNWAGFRSEDLGTTFHRQDGLWVVPFTDVRSRESLIPRFTFSPIDAWHALRHLLRCCVFEDRFVVIDIPLTLGLVEMGLFEVADAVYYLMGPQDHDLQMARRFQEEATRLGSLRSRVVFVRNKEDAEEAPDQEFEREFVLPIATDGEGMPTVNPNVISDANSIFTKGMASIAARARETPYNQWSEDINMMSAKDRAQEEIIKTYQDKLRAKVVSSLERKYGLSDRELLQRVEASIEKEFAAAPPPEIPDRNLRAELKKLMIDEILGLGPLEDLIRDPDVDEIMVNGPNQIFIEKSGKLHVTDRSFNNSDHLRAVIDRILMPIGRTVNERTPYVDGRLADGSRVHAIIPPLSLVGPMLTVRKFSRKPFTMDDLVFRFKTMTPEVAEFLKLCVKLRKNIIVSGGASSGKTTLLNVLTTYIPDNERLLTIEDSAELRVVHTHIGRLEARQQGTEAKTQVTIRDLVRNALRMRPDRIIVGECRGEEALDMLQAMNTGHEGSLTTLHANAPRDALARLETMVLMAGVDLPSRAIREQIASSINVVIQTGRISDGSRKVTEVVEVDGIDGLTIRTRTLFRFEKRWINEDGRVFGEIVPTGEVPGFLADLRGGLDEATRRLFAAPTEAPPAAEAPIAAGASS